MCEYRIPYLPMVHTSKCITSPASGILPWLFSHVRKQLRQASNKLTWQAVWVDLYMLIHRWLAAGQTCQNIYRWQFNATAKRSLQLFLKTFELDAHLHKTCLILRNNGILRAFQHLFGPLSKKDDTRSSNRLLTLPNRHVIQNKRCISQYQCVLLSGLSQMDEHNVYCLYLKKSFIILKTHTEFIYAVQCI